MPPRRLVPSPVLGAVLACLLLLTGCTSLQGTGDKGYVTGDGSVNRLDPSDRGDAVALDGEDLDGEDLSVASYLGKPVVIVVWGSWCTPCRAEAPEVVAASKELAGIAEFIGINLRNGSTDNGKGFVRTFGVPYPSFYSPNGEAMLAFPGTLGPNTIPAFVVLDAQGRVAASIIGGLPSQLTLVDLVKDVAAESASSGAPLSGSTHG